MTSRRGSLEVPARVDRGLRPGLVFMTLHFPDQVDTNILTIDATDPKSGTAEFKATAVRIEKIPESVEAVAPPWTSSCPTTSPATTNAPPSTRSSARRAPAGPVGNGPRRTGVWLEAGTRRGSSATCCSPSCMRCSRARAGSVPGGLRYACERLTVPPAEAYGVATFYAMFSVEPRPTTVLHLCDDIACKVAGAEGLIERGRSGQVGSERVLRSPCLGMCERAPAALLQGSGSRDVAFGPVSVERLDPFLRGGPWTTMSDAEVIDVAPQTHATREQLRLLRRVGVVDPASLDDYRAHGGYEALRRAVELGPEGVIAELKDSKLQGRGGAAFPAGREVGGGREAAGPTPLLHLQRRRIRARHVQGPGPDGARPVRGPRVAHDRRVRDGFARRGSSTSAASTRSRPRGSSTRSSWRTPTGSSAPT